MVSRNDDNFVPDPPRRTGDGGGGAHDGGGDDALAEQVLRYLAGHASADAVADLGDRLTTDARARDLFVRVCLLDSLLAEKFAPGRREFMSETVLEDHDRDAGSHGASSLDAIAMRAIADDDAFGETDEPEPIELPTYPKPPPATIPWWRMRRTWAAAAVLVLALGLWAVISRLSSPADAPLVATLTGAKDVKWAHAGPPPSVGQSLPASSELFLRSGLARLTFRGGAKLVIEGPARFTPDTAGQLTLASGRVTALVPPAAKGFTVKTPTAEIVDLGTEFGVDVPRGTGAAVEVQVFEGVVTLQPAATTPQATSGPSSPSGQSTSARPPAQVVRAGTGARIDPVGAITTVPANPALFVRAAEAEAMDRASEGSAFDRWVAYRYELARDPDVIAYYPFDTENKTRLPERLANASGAGAALDGTLASDGGTKPEWVAGRWPQKAALKFAGTPDAPRVVFPPDAFDFAGTGAAGTLSQPFTVAVWIKARSHPAPGRSIVGRGRIGREQFALNTESTFYRFGLRDGAGPDARFFPLNSRNFPSDKWHHVAATYDPVAGRMTLYVDGAAVQDGARGAGEAPQSLLRTADPVVLGGRMGQAGGFQMPLEGLVDELVFVQRVLAPGDVQRMYEVGRPE